MTRIYTKSGDSGETSLIGGRRSPKDDKVFFVLGSLDELSAALGLASAEISRVSGGEQMAEPLEQVQADLIKICAELAAAPGSSSDLMGETRVLELERQIDGWWNEMPPLTKFILPGGTPAGAVLHLARAICRRAERDMIALGRESAVRPELNMYMNRLSDWLFAAARYGNYKCGCEEKSV